jgi:hypothetical protein
VKFDVGKSKKMEGELQQHDYQDYYDYQDWLEGAEWIPRKERIHYLSVWFQCQPVVNQPVVT